MAGWQERFGESFSICYGRLYSGSLIVVQPATYDFFFETYLLGREPFGYVREKLYRIDLYLIFDDSHEILIY